MRALLVVAHGSRRVASNDEVRQLTDELRAAAGDEYAQVECAFLELAQPSIPDGIDCCVAEGATEVVILPYFLSAGRHVAKDIPEIPPASPDCFTDRLHPSPCRTWGTSFPRSGT